ncbi:MAG TPA: choice-of-anchor D domain-containing protein [Rhodanobacteraceae bacterium]|nr:choice-of-anchor D domain-containing protein [Rhodanobacteraceae bacterium]
MTTRLRCVRAGLRVLALATLALFSSAQAANTPMRKILEFARTDVATAAAGGIGAPADQGGGDGTLELDGVSGNITRALLYWNGIDIEYPAIGLTGGDGDYDQPQITFDGVAVTGTLVAAGGSNDCWPDAQATLPPSAATWRADVTDRVRMRGDGTYAFSGLSEKPGHSANGISLIVYFDDGNPANDLRIAHYEGLQSNRDSMRFETGFDYAGGAVEAVLQVSDGQSLLADSSLTWNTLPGMSSGSSTTLRYVTLYDGLTLWPGSTVPHMGHQRGDRPDTLWDIRHMPLTAMLGAPRRYATSFDYTSAQDCVSLQVVQLVQRADPAVPMLAPNPFDFGDVVAGGVSPAQRFTFTNWMPAPVQIGTPTFSGDPMFALVADTCAAQTLAPGASCTLDATFEPPLPGAPLAFDASLIVPFEDGVVHDPNPGEPYASLRGSSIPDAPFARVTFEPDVCAFAPTPIGTTSPPIRFRLRSSGTLPLVLDAVTASSSAFPLLATTCTAGAPLAPGSECALVVAFRPSSTTLATGSVRARWHADGMADASTYLPLQGRGVAGGSDGVFADGFESAVCY